MHCYWILEQITEALVKYADKNPDDFTKRIIGIISFKKNFELFLKDHIKFKITKLKISHQI